MTDRTDLELIPVPWPGLSNLLSLFGLGLLAWGTAAEIINRDAGAGRAAAVALTVAASSAWVVALVLRRDPSPVAGAAVLVMALAGGALVAFAPIAMVFPAVAVFAAAVRWRLEVTVAVGAAGWLSVVVAEVAVGPTTGVVLGALAAVLAGTLVGIARRQAVDRAAQEARTEVETLRAEVERERAELLSERNHLAREIHDVLAHTLAALSLQLEAFGTVVESEPDTTAAVRDQLERTRQLVREGLEEASGAVRALRDDAQPLDAQLVRLCAQRQAEFSVSGVPRPLPPQVVLALFRAAQEALTNVMKHATGAPTSVCLAYGEDDVSVVVENRGSPGSPTLHHTGNGFGLQGITERLALLGGRLEAGPTTGGWRVAATAPLPVAAPDSGVPT